jgi:hypothetical protein
VKRRRYGRRRSCEGKVRHTSRADALAHRDRLIALGDTRLTVYPCRHCDGHYRPAR